MIPGRQFQRERWQKNDMTPNKEPLTEHQALRLAINALNGIPNSRIRMEGYKSTYDLIPELEKAYASGAKENRNREAVPELLEAVKASREMFYTLGDKDTQESKDCFALYELCDTALAKTLPEYITAEQDRGKLLDTTRNVSEPNKDIEPER